MADTFHALVEQSIPDLRRYAIALCRNPDAADDLVQDTVVRSLSARGQFAEGTNFRAWVSTILRNRFMDQRRRSRESTEPYETVVDKYLVALPSQEPATRFGELTRAFSQLSPSHQEILMLIGVHGLSYREASKAIGRTIGTVRSRLSRARVELRSVMDGPPETSRLRLKPPYIPTLPSSLHSH